MSKFNMYPPILFSDLIEQLEDTIKNKLLEIINKRYNGEDFIETIPILDTMIFNYMNEINPFPKKIIDTTPYNRILYDELTK